MKFIFISLPLFVILISCGNSRVNRHKYDYPGLGQIVEGYYWDYYDYPSGVNDLILFANTHEFPECFNTTIKKINIHKDEIILRNENRILTVRLGDHIIYETAHRSPCEELSYNMGIYLERVLFFDEEGFSINSDEITNQFKRGMKEIKIAYNESNKEKVYVMLDFVRFRGLRIFCNDNIQIKNCKYFREVEKYLNIFSEKYSIDKVVFVVPDP